MRNLEKLFWVACAVFFFTSCEETYNDKLFWPGEISREYGSYIKPYTLDLTYSGEKLIGKTVSFKTENSETGTLTLNDVIPGEANTPINGIKLYENEEKGNYTFSGTNRTMGGATVKYSGSITPKAMKLDLNVVIAQSQLVGTFNFPDFKLGTKSIIANTKLESGGYGYIWTDKTNQITEGAGYFNVGNDAELTKRSSTLFTNGKILQNALCYFLPQLLNGITLQADGNIIANYTTSSLQIGDKKIDEIDMTNDMTTLASFGMKILGLSKLTIEDIEKAINKSERKFDISPINLVTWAKVGNKVIIKLNLPSIISLIIKNSGKEVDPALISGITEAIAKSNPIKLKSLLSTLNTILDNQAISFISTVEDSTFKMLFDYIIKGIPLGMDTNNGHTYLYLTKESTAPVIAFLPKIQPIVSELITLPDTSDPNYFMMYMLKNLIDGYLGTESGSFYDCWQAAETIDLGIDLITTTNK
ncbi:DUF4925 domain-containing protein [Bacteroides congonensis]|uniref:DUF4925 domain-containing protein n=1 Tax=Bacteroides congonensis TaxID=1871006 RepID=UPI00189783FA|nr:DUF4925 domain-containing protein [Bacteroides congonensis]